MHPNKFFKETNLRTGIDTFEIFDGDLKQKLSELHPLNFIKTKSCRKGFNSQSTA